MSTDLTLAGHLEGLRAAVVAFVRHAERAGLDTHVPTCPDWSVRRLVAHQGMVHRWAAAVLRGQRTDADASELEGRSTADPLGWLEDGALDLVAAIHEAPEDVRTVVFLNDAPAPRQFWARRQCHETTVHAVDALSAALGRYPGAADTWVDPVQARDGIDELLGGFVTRNHSRVRCAEQMRLGVLPTDADEGWLVEVSARPAARGAGRRSRRGAPGVVGLALPRPVEPCRRGQCRARPLGEVAGPVVDRLGMIQPGPMSPGRRAGRSGRDEFLDTDLFNLEH